MNRTKRSAAIALLAAASFAILPATSASAHDGKGKQANGTRSGKSHKASVIARLVTAGTITQAQGDAINTAIAASTAPRSTSDAERKAKYTAITAPLVANGTISQAQADAVVAAIVADGVTKGLNNKTPKTKSTTSTTVKAA
jgi:Spy/CpxP family protein refolding chaperone